MRRCRRSDNERKQKDEEEHKEIESELKNLTKKTRI